MPYPTVRLATPQAIKFTVFGARVDRKTPAAPLAQAGRGAAVGLQSVRDNRTIAANEDLLRALRLAWIEAAFEVDAAALLMTAMLEWQSSDAEADRFSAHLRTHLRQLRHEACDRSMHPGSTAIDVHLNEVLVRVPDYVRGAAGLLPGEALTRGFVSTLAAVTAWPERELPSFASC